MKKIESKQYLCCILCLDQGKNTVVEVKLLSSEMEKVLSFQRVDFPQVFPIEWKKICFFRAEIGPDDQNRVLATNKPVLQVIETKKASTTYELEVK